MKFAIYPETSLEKGYAHIKRCISLSKSLNAPLFIPKEELTSALAILLFNKVELILNYLDSHEIECIIIDKPEISEEKINHLIQSGYKIISIEGNVRDKVHYLIDILPNIYKEEANISSLKLLGFETKKHVNKIIRNKKHVKKILISFGGYDYKRFSEALYKSQIIQNTLKDAKVSLLKGPGAIWIEAENFLGWTLIENKENIDFDFLNDFDLVITYYGQIMFESLLSGINVLLLNYSEYHSRLAKSIKIKEFGIETPNRHVFENLFLNTKHFKKQFDFLKREEEIKYNSLADLLQKFEKQKEFNCPVCYSNFIKVNKRLKDKTIFICLSCYVEFVQFFIKENLKTETDNVFQGDLKSVLKEIKKKNKKEMTLIDIGKYNENFLRFLTKRKFKIKIFAFNRDKKTADRIQSDLNAKTISGDFVQIDFKRELEVDEFDVVTMWNSLQTYPILKEVLKKINAMLKLDGTFIFSIPNIFGAKTKEKFYENLPETDNTIWNHKKIKNILNVFGFRIYKIKSKQDTLKRFPKILTKIIIVKQICQLISAKSILGETMEVYAKKIDNA